PARAICPMVRYPELKTMALGGVPAGRQNAIEQPIATEPMSTAGGMPREIAAPAMTGMAIAVTAVLDVISVRKMKSVADTPSITIIGHPASADTPPPIQVARPVLDIASASASPPPNSSSTPHGIFTALFQSSATSPFFQSKGMAKRMSAH